MGEAVVLLLLLGTGVGLVVVGDGVDVFVLLGGSVAGATVGQSVVTCDFDMISQL